MRPPRGPSARPLSRAQKRPAAGAAPVAVVPARPKRWRAGTKKVCGRSGAGRAGTGPARPPPPHRSGPALSGPGPWSACVRSRCWPPGCGGPQPPRRGALPWGRWPGRWLRPPWRGVGGLACVRAAACAYTDLPRRGPPQRPGGGVGAAPCLGPARGSLWAGPGRRSVGQRPPGPAPCPTPGRGGTMPPGRRGFGAPLRAAARRPPMRGAGVWIPPPAGGGGRQRGGRVCAGNPGRVSCTMMIPIFQNFLKF